MRKRAEKHARRRSLLNGAERKFDPSRPELDFVSGQNDLRRKLGPLLTY